MGNWAAEAIVMQNQIERVIEREKKEDELIEIKQSKGKQKQIVICSWCNAEVEGIYFYRCEEHKKNYCADCATGGNAQRIGVKEWDVAHMGKMPKCDKLRNHECIYQRRELYL